MLFVMRTLVRGQRVVERFVEAGSLERAFAVGKVWCEQHSDHRLVGVEKAVVADESLLTAEALQPPTRVGA